MLGDEGVILGEENKLALALLQDASFFEYEKISDGSVKPFTLKCIWSS